jgi:hypothetical protein
MRHAPNASQKQELGLSKVKNTSNGKSKWAPSCGYTRNLAEERQFCGEQIYLRSNWLFILTRFSSTVIENIRACQSSSENAAVAFFYCSFTDSEKQRIFSIICSFLLQLAQGLPQVPTSLLHLYAQYKNMQPSIDNLKMTLLSVLEESGETFLIIDALDECIDEDGSRKQILTLLEELSMWNRPNVHILVTSRKEPDIEHSLTSLKTLRSVCIQTQQQNDIKIYVNSILETAFNSKKWTPEVKEEIKEALVNNADGM